MTDLPRWQEYPAYAAAAAQRETLRAGQLQLTEAVNAADAELSAADARLANLKALKQLGRAAEADIEAAREAVKQARAQREEAAADLSANQQAQSILDPEISSLEAEARVHTVSALQDRLRPVLTEFAASIQAAGDHYGQVREIAGMLAVAVMSTRPEAFPGAMKFDGFCLFPELSLSPAMVRHGGSRAARVLQEIERFLSPPDGEIEQPRRPRGRPRKAEAVTG